MMGGEEVKPQVQPAQIKQEASTSSPPAPAPASAPASAPAPESAPESAPASAPAPAPESAPAPVNANPGEAISCSGYNPRGDGAIYRYDGDRKMRWYPNPQIASSWDSNWPSGANRKVDCTGFILGDDVQMKSPMPPPTNDSTSECNKDACNNIMKDWIVNKYWAFSDTAKNFGECKGCGSRWFKAPMNTSTDGTSWKNHGGNRNAAFDAVKL